MDLARVDESSREPRGFTMVELMIVVVILGVLSSIALVAYSQWVRKSKTSEAVSNIQRIYAGQVAYVTTAQERTTTSSFVNAPPMPPAAPTSSKYPVDLALWLASPEWSVLNFSIDNGHYYQYASPGGPGSFTARAIGNLDGDSVFSTFERTGVIAPGGDIAGTGVLIYNELE